MPADGSDFTVNSLGSYQGLNEVKNKYAGATPPSNPAIGCSFFDTDDDELRAWDGDRWRALYDSTDVYVMPEGSIIAWLGGYFTDGSNGGFSNVLGNTVAAANALFNGSGWYVCDGAALNDSDSTIFNGASRYLPNLTDDRFTMGDTAAGGTGGASAQAHTHAVNPVSKATGNESNTVDVDILSPVESVADFPHTHDVDYASKTSEAASNTENRPAYLQVIYLMRVK